MFVFIIPFLLVFMVTCIQLLIPLAIIYFIFRKINGYKFIWLDKSLPKDIPYFRDIPCGGDLERAYFILYEYKIVKRDTLKDNIISAFILKWLDLEYIKIIPGSDNKIDLSNHKFPKTIVEEELYDMLKSASINDILEVKEFKRWSKKNSRRIKKWLILLRNNQIDNLEVKDYRLVKEDAIKLIGLKKYLLNFSKIDKKEYKDVQIWQKYLIFSQLMGLNKKIEKQFKHLNLDFNEIHKTEFNLVQNLIFKGIVLHIILHILPFIFIFVIFLLSFIFSF